MHRSPVPAGAEYALRAACCLTALPPGAAMTARELAVHTRVPPAYLAKVLRRLVQHGILEAQKGRAGGFRLARPPRAISLLDVLDAAQSGPTPNACAFGLTECDPDAPCPLHHLYTSLHAASRSWAREHTLADLDLSRIFASKMQPRIPTTAGHVRDLP